MRNSVSSLNKLWLGVTLRTTPKGQIMKRDVQHFVDYSRRHQWGNLCDHLMT